MRGLFAVPLMFIRLVYQSVYLALGQIWANKTRSILTTVGIVIGVASVTAVIAALTGLKAKILSQVETFGSNTIIVQPQLPDKGLKRTLTWWDVRFKIRDFEGLLEHCPSLQRFTKISEAGQYTIKYNEKSVQNAHIYGVAFD
jgi:putative ABC transport system permease protein